jgi:hypothetical protein
MKIPDNRVFDYTQGTSLPLSPSRRGDKGSETSLCARRTSTMLVFVDFPTENVLQKKLSAFNISSIQTIRIMT